MGVPLLNPPLEAALTQRGQPLVTAKNPFICFFFNRKYLGQNSARSGTGSHVSGGAESNRDSITNITGTGSRGPDSGRDRVDESNYDR